MIQRDDILSMEYLKKTEFTGCHQGMRYRLEHRDAGEGREVSGAVWVRGEAGAAGGYVRLVGAL